VRDIFASQMRYYLAVRDSDISATRNIFRVADVVETPKGIF
jgi:hypothetical protein